MTWEVNIHFALKHVIVIYVSDIDVEISTREAEMKSVEKSNQMNRGLFSLHTWSIDI